MGERDAATLRVIKLRDGGYTGSACHTIVKLISK